MTDNDVIISNVRLANVKFIQEKKIILKFFEEVAVDSGRYCFGVDETLKVRRRFVAVMLSLTGA